MIGRAVVVVAVLSAIGGCSPPARSVSYFQAHPDEAQATATQCTSGAVRGKECENAAAAVQLLAADKAATARAQAFRSMHP